MHHAVEGAAGVRRLDIEAGPLDAVLGEVVQQADAVDGKTIGSDGGLPPFGPRQGKTEGRFFCLTADSKNRPCCLPFFVC